ncbi:hypothetical protein ACFQ3P_38550 [Paraburkholderia sabiae]|uniref:Uncharacterized protein n=1 Tax=Paraburkholderia sabiae TaxID=273251 RepID=A0ABU9QPW3_9BURK|nr:hypothetical protein [Paraburkholderia sabiae]WJZ74387.1 hypothetical protein QEN71_00805 [Paraburkholderia sabiae]CAD6562651.1 hypothetical protein LMG24235_07890 [Paraburkholderia sabiae]
MNCIDYQKEENLEAVAARARNAVNEGVKVFNFIIAAELSREAIENAPLADVTDIAEKWRQPNVPDDLIINHGSYFQYAIAFLTDELRQKPTSNRALYSLINTKDISESGDRPIPSFLIFQCGLDGDTLYCTVYLRALEIANFLRINLEEIRLNLCEVLKRVHAVRVRLAVFAFGAYNRPNQSTLIKPELDRLSDVDFRDVLDFERARLVEMLIEKSQEATFIDVKRIATIADWSAAGRARRPNLANINQINHLAFEAVKAGNELAAVRLLHSHHDVVVGEAEKYTAAVTKLALEFRKCP